MYMRAAQKIRLAAVRQVRAVLPQVDLRRRGLQHVRLVDSVCARAA
jgi:hypothetical protein